ncbi:hypothetical protein AX774_g789 [Zancudomyces culisetae]|uniref:Uncharacterized protein n=1 Tax=Zancudomyces culisetae TaxID=1213189 RepID=A0A1R1PXM8_ZANCU|nr:hypothetical protein AX774_g789 [Zancudomyces culisetae]|eukprot:OMH85657.1 hypothetical protein AX774_g789 [Zancudomyces culisetae]
MHGVWRNTKPTRHSNKQRTTVMGLVFPCLQTSEDDGDTDIFVKLTDNSIGSSVDIRPQPAATNCNVSVIFSLYNAMGVAISDGTGDIN